MKLYVVYNEKLLVGEGINPEKCIEVLEDKIRKMTTRKIHSITHRYDKTVKNIIITFREISNEKYVSHVDEWITCDIYSEDFIKKYYKNGMSRFAINSVDDRYIFFYKRKDNSKWEKVCSYSLATTFPDRESAKACFEEIKEQGIEDTLTVVEFQYKAY